MTGLTSEQVLRKEKNTTDKKRTKSYLEIFIRNIFTPLNMILIAMVVLILIAGLYKRLLFSAVLACNLFLGIFQDIKAKRLVEKISLNTAPRSIVIRDDKEQEIPSSEIVLNDIIILKAGMVVPSDAKIISGEIKVNESLLTGENNPITKIVDSTIYKESAVISGRAMAEVIAVGKNNYCNTLESKAKVLSRPDSELLTSVNKILRVLSVVAILIGALELTIYILQKYQFVPLIDTFTSSIVSMLPNGMMLLMSLSLTVGVITLANKHMLVQELYSIENLARVDTLCVDKTGTLTDGNMEVVGEYSNRIVDIVSRILFATQDDNITAKALKAKFGITAIKGNYKVIAFDSKNKYSGYKLGSSQFIIGAYGFATHDKKWAKLVEKYEKEGNRVLCVVANNSCIGLVRLIEHIKEGTAETIKYFKDNEVNVVVISGDSPLSIKCIANKVGIEGDCVSLEGKKDEEVREIVKSAKYNIYGRVSPEQKKIIVEELKLNKHKVAMVGDGVNDLLALKSADCSIAMSSGSDAIKGASHLVSLDSKFSSFPSVVEEGRRVINNLQRVCSLFLIKTYFAITMCLIFLVASLVSKEMTYPFVSNNLFVWEAVTIGICPFFIALEPNRTRVKGSFIKTVLNKTLPAGVCQVGVILMSLLIGKITNSFNSAIQVSAILISVLPFIYLWIICLPLTLYRFVVLLFCSVLGLAFLGFDYILFRYSNVSILEIKYNLITWQMGVISGIIALLFVVVYVYYERKVKGHLIQEIKEKEND